MTNPGKYCDTCGNRSTVTTSKTRRSWDMDHNCRSCRYILEHFSMNGNYLKEYW